MPNSILTHQKVAHNLKSKYGITVQEYDGMVLAQDGKCASCDEPAKLVVDHCHRTGRVRALLCHQCNRHLGVFEKYRARFEEYLGRHGIDREA